LTSFSTAETREEERLFWFRLPPATKAPRGRPSPRRGAEENGKKTARKLVGRDKGSLTEQQTKGTVTTTIQIRRNHDKTDRTTEPLSRTEPALRAPEPRVSPRRAAPPPPEPSMTAHSMEYPALFGQVGVGPAPRLCPFLDSGEN